MSGSPAIQTPPDRCVEIYSPGYPPSQQENARVCSSAVSTIGRESTREESAEPFAIGMQDAYRSGGGGVNPAVCPRICVTAREGARGRRARIVHVMRKNEQRKATSTAPSPLNATASMVLYNLHDSLPPLAVFYLPQGSNCLQILHTPDR